MELVYLWVENYKNIKNQGFNFSPRFECSYNEKTNELTIDEKKDYVSIFPENINVTAIVGENGSGKSSILNCINDILWTEYKNNDFFDFNHESYLGFRYLLVISINDTLHYISEGVDIDIIEVYNKQDLEHFIYSNENIELNKQILLTQQEISKMIVYSYLNDESFELSSFMYFPEIIIIQKKNFEAILEKLLDNNNLYYWDRTLRDPDNWESKESNKEIVKEIFKKESSEYNKFLILYYIIKKADLDIYSFQDITRLLEDSIFIDIISEEEFEKHFLDTTKNIIDLELIEKSIYIEKYFDFFEYDFIDSFSRSFNNLSHGEKIIFGQLLNIFYYSTKLESSNFLFLLDEPEISLHPKWQKNYINELNNLLSRLDKNYHIITGTHSPFLISDLPKENVIFLKKDENENCKNVTKETDINPFGTNIHTLLSHGFFMEDGLMGEFAKSKIEEIKKFYEQIKKREKRIKNSQKLLSIGKKIYERKEKNFQNIHKIIGEPFLKTVIGNYLDELHLILSDDKTLIEKELEELDKRKRYLESLQDD